VNDDLTCMAVALMLAERGAGLVSPNPLVGAVLVDDGQVVGQGFHRFDLLRHAESYAIESAGSRAQGATLYINLEPCSHHGRTPPCTDALIEAGIRRAVISIKDPDPRVDGRGIEQLRAAGVEVDLGLAQHEARRLNETYLKYITSGRPFVHSVVDLRPNGGGESRWEPSAQFLEAAAAYDSVLLGHGEGSRRLLEAIASKPRHRSLLVFGDAESARELVDIPVSAGLGDAAMLESSSTSAGAHGSLAYSTSSERAPLDFITAPGEIDFRSVLDLATSAGATSLLVMPDAVGSDRTVAAEVDKVTLVTVDGDAAARKAFEDANRDVEPEILDDPSQTPGGFLELRYYRRAPRRR
jgi:diaminohydroxyphosphoribosylaminopyrimidine deaminase/5-amino-6-(5-phosphoribosylamino)uracil reductase